ncbi:ATP-dependent endonuclease [Rothia sp. HMSC065C03]|jgi:hypothetical protein|uniref:ATP-dependent nuclease n=1 Tax=Rothia sp. HMSC065C03 TaxID=1715084 RepID=UPI0008AA561C|nr:AAA family ATPase [Rothia sp. HMSC065C03]OHQ19484.1 hypothetical protein HMPREF2605_07940 [Rothia sp. HMSC065C03]
MSVYLSKVSLVNFRNFKNAVLRFNPGVNTIIGENGAGKTNIFHAIRLLLDDTLPNSYSYFTEKDFNRDIGDWRGHWIIIRLEFTGSTYNELMNSFISHCLNPENKTEIPDCEIDSKKTKIYKYSCSIIFRPKLEIRSELYKAQGNKSKVQEILNKISIADYESVRIGKGNSDFHCLADYQKCVGDFKNLEFPDPEDTEMEKKIGIRLPKIFYIPREFNTFYIDALRDVQRSFQGQYRNPLRDILEIESSGIENDPSFNNIAKMAGKLNDLINKNGKVSNLANNVLSTYKEAVGSIYSPGTLSIKSQLPVEAKELFHALSIYIGGLYSAQGNYQGSIDELSLGHANMLYISLKLLEFKSHKISKSNFSSPISNILLIEEPESHIHPHIQKVIFSNVGNDKNTQVIYSTHSPQISEISNIKNVNVILQDGNESWIACSPSSGLKEEEIIPVNRFLDITRCNLLFARGVILVEGDAEEMLIPYLIKKVYGVSLDELGISLINNRGVGFDGLASIFHADRLQKRCSIITDLDTYMENNKFSSPKAAKLGTSRQNALNQKFVDNRFVKSYFAEYTFEVEFALAGQKNIGQLIKFAEENKYKDIRALGEIKNKLLSKDNAKVAEASLQLTEKNDINIGKSGKGWSALMLCNYISKETIIPHYILEAVLFSIGGRIPDDIKQQISKYRDIEFGKDDATRKLIELEECDG